MIFRFQLYQQTFECKDVISYIYQFEHVVLGAQKKHLIETGLLSTHNKCFGSEIRKIISIYTLLSGGLSMQNMRF